MDTFLSSRFKSHSADRESVDLSLVVALWPTLTQTHTMIHTFICVLYFACTSGPWGQILDFHWQINVKSLIIYVLNLVSWFLHSVWDSLFIVENNLKTHSVLLWRVQTQHTTAESRSIYLFWSFTPHHMVLVVFTPWTDIFSTGVFKIKNHQAQIGILCCLL